VGGAPGAFNAGRYPPVCGSLRLPLKENGWPLLTTGESVARHGHPNQPPPAVGERQRECGGFSLGSHDREEQWPRLSNSPEFDAAAGMGAETLPETNL